MGFFDCVKKGGVAQDVVNSAGAVRPPASEVGFSWVVEWGYRDIVMAYEVGEGTVGEGLASDGGVGVGKCVCMCVCVCV